MGERERGRGWTRSSRVNSGAPEPHCSSSRSRVIRWVPDVVPPRLGMSCVRVCQQSSEIGLEPRGLPGCCSLCHTFMHFVLV